jgi:hypothetical protein
MTEKTKKRIKKEFDTLLRAIGNKETQLLAIRTTEEDMPTTQKEALDDVLKGNPEHEASETTNARLVRWSTVRDGVNSFHGQVLEERNRIPITEENEYLNTIEEYCKSKTREINGI